MKKWINHHPISTFLLATLFFVLIMVIQGLLSYGSSFIQDFVANWLATFLGIAIGVPLALWANNYQDKITEKERREKILKLLYSELNFNLLNLRAWFEDKNLIISTSGYFTAFMKDELWNAFSDGGEIQWIKDLTLLDLLSNAYFRVNCISNITEWVIAVGPTKTAIYDNNTWFDLLVANIEDTIDHIQEALKLIEKTVDITDKAEISPTFMHG